MSPWCCSAFLIHLSAVNNIAERQYCQDASGRAVQHRGRSWSRKIHVSAQWHSGTSMGASVFDSPNCLKFQATALVL